MPVTYKEYTSARVIIQKKKIIINHSNLLIKGKIK